MQRLGLEHDLLVEAARAALEGARETIGAGGTPPKPEAVLQDAVARAQAFVNPHLVPVINATGVVIHTNLGRAPLHPAAVNAVLGYSNLEYDLERGRRGSRRQHVERLICDLARSEAALVVNNNAAAVMLMLAALAPDKEVLISRSELVEIGGSFRVPEIMAASGARLKEVGTTNRTYASDYEAAIGPETAAILKVHRSNFRVTGFTHEATSAELVAVGRRHGLMTLYDLGSAAFLPLPAALHTETMVTDELQVGMDVVSFSGDKVLGGPQAGILVGSRDAIERLAHHPMARALRVDKMTLAALQTTLLACREGRPEQIPVLAMLHASQDDLMQRAKALADELGGDFEACEVEDAVGGGSHPDETLPGAGLVLSLPSDGALARAAAALRMGDPPVIAVVHDHRLWIHLRTVSPGEEEALVKRLRALVSA